MVNIPIKDSPKNCYVIEQLASKGVKIGIRRDSLLVEVELPPNWQVEYQYNKYYRYQTIFDHNKEQVAKTYLFDNGYHYRGETILANSKTKQ